MSHLARTFAALSDKSRLTIVETLLAHGEMPAGSLAAAAPVSGPAISRHLKVLREAGLVEVRTNGPQRLYSVPVGAFSDLSDWLQKHRDFWNAGLDRLDAHLKSETNQNKD